MKTLGTVSQHRVTFHQVEVIQAVERHDTTKAEAISKQMNFKDGCNKLSQADRSVCSVDYFELCRKTLPYQDFGLDRKIHEGQERWQFPSSIGMRKVLPTRRTSVNLRQDSEQFKVQASAVKDSDKATTLPPELSKLVPPCAVSPRLPIRRESICELTLDVTKLDSIHNSRWSR